MVIQTHEAEYILPLIQKWQKPVMWQLAKEMSEHWTTPRDQSSLDDDMYARETSQYASQLADWQADFGIIEKIIRGGSPELLQFTPTVDLFFFSNNVDAKSCIQLLKQLEGSLLSMLSPDESKNEGTTEGTKNVWKEARELNSKITIPVQMIALFKNDNSIVDRKSLSKAVSTILGCSESAVRHPGNEAWKFFRTELARRKKLRQERQGKRWVESDQNDADD